MLKYGLRLMCRRNICLSSQRESMSVSRHMLSARSVSKDVNACSYAAPLRASYGLPCCHDIADALLFDSQWIMDRRDIDPHWYFERPQHLSPQPACAWTVLHHAFSRQYRNRLSYADRGAHVQMILIPPLAETHLIGSYLSAQVSPSQSQHLHRIMREISAWTGPPAWTCTGRGGQSLAVGISMLRANGMLTIDL